jgi:deazaflavin-dependent oxidoreductase (nitroreductase family)
MTDHDHPDSFEKVHRPSRLLKFVFDVPSLLYGWGLGWALGRRALAVTHTGRNSGRIYTTILEVIGFDNETKESIVASAYGTKADWYRNIQRQPAKRIQTGRLDYTPQQRFLSGVEAKEAAARFCEDHPWEAKLVPRVLPSIGAAVRAEPDATPSDLLASLPMVAFRPDS